MELRDIRYFLALSEELNFTRAANTCGVSQPALTRAIQKMENELGGLLFSRERGNTHMTALGQLVAPHLCGAISHIGTARQVAERFLNLEDAQLTIGVMRTLEPTQFVSLLRRFRSSHPGVEVSFCQSNPERLCDLLLKGKLHLALLSLPDELPSSLQAAKLYSEPYVMACSPDHRFTEREIVSGTDLTGEVYISQPDTRLDPVMRDPFLRRGIKLLKSDDEEGEDWVVTMVAAGFGVSLVPAYTASHPEVIYLPFAPPLLSRDISLVTVAGRRWSPVIAAFVNLVRRHQWSQARGCYGLRIKSPALISMRQANETTCSSAGVEAYRSQ